MTKVTIDLTEENYQILEELVTHIALHTHPDLTDFPVRSQHNVVIASALEVMHEQLVQPFRKNAAVEGADHA